MDRAILDAFDEEAEAFLTGTDLIVRCLLFGDVTNDLGKADEAAVGILDSINDCLRPEAASVLANAPVLTFVIPSLAATRNARAGKFADRSSSVKNIAKCRPSASLVVYPLKRSAPEFQVTTAPFASSM